MAHYRNKTINQSKKNKLYTKYMKVRTAQNKQNYLNNKNKPKYITRILERDHIENFLNKYRSNLSKSWGITKDIINRNKSILIKWEEGH